MKIVILDAATLTINNDIDYLLQDITTLIWNIQEKKGLRFVMPEVIQQRQWLSTFLHLYFIITTQSQGMMNL